MASFIREVFARRAAAKVPVFVGFAMHGFPSVSSTSSFLLALERGGADVIELALPHSDPVADGPTLQTVSQAALASGASSSSALEQLASARAAGLRAPVVMFGYYNTFRAYGLARFCRDAHAAGADGILCVDLPPEQFGVLAASPLAVVPLVTPTTLPERLRSISELPNTGFLYCVALLGVTGARTSLPSELPTYMANVREAAGKKIPTVVGFGISSRQLFEEVAQHADGVVAASAMLDAVLRARAAGEKEIDGVVQSFVANLTGRTASLGFPDRSGAGSSSSSSGAGEESEAAGRTGGGWYGKFGGAYIPETLRFAVDELSAAFDAASKDASFWAELRSFDSYVGRPTPLHEAVRLKSEGGARIWLKREDLSHTGAHKINNALGQALLAKRIGKKRIIAETGAGQHGVAVATVCAKLGMQCTVYMGAVDIERQKLNVFRMKAMGAEIVSVESGTKTLKDAVNEAMRAWVTSVRDTHYIIGSALGPHPFPLICREFQKIIGEEAKRQFREQNEGRLPEVVMACIGGGSNAIGMFHDFVPEASVRLIGVEAAGKGIESGQHCAPLSLGTPGVLHGSLSYLMQDVEGQISETHSISAGLDYPGVGPEHSHYKDTGRAEYTYATDEEVLEAFELLCRTEGIIPALESSHAISAAVKLAKTMKPHENVLICLSGRGDKDIFTVAKHKGFEL